MPTTGLINIFLSSNIGLVSTNSELCGERPQKVGPVFRRCRTRVGLKKLAR